MSQQKNEQFERELRHLVNSCIERFGHNYFRRMLSAKDLPAGTGRLDTLGKLIEHSSKIDCIRELESIKEDYYHHVLFGDKAVQFFSIEPEIMLQLVKLFDDFQPKSPFSKHYPLPLPSENLKDFYSDNSSEPFPTCKEHNDLAIMFSSVRYFAMQFELESVDLPDNLKLEYDQVFARKFNFRQFFDAIILRPDKNMIEFVVDSLNTTEQSQSKQQRDEAFKLLRKWLLEFTHNRLSDRSFLPDSPRDLQPSITPLCRDKDEGLLKKYYFVTDDALDDHAFAKQTERDKNLRDDEFLRKGEEAVPIDIYRGMVAWPAEQRPLNDYIPHLELHMNGRKPRSSSSAKPLKEAILIGASCQEEYDFLCSKVFQYLD